MRRVSILLIVFVCMSVVPVLAGSSDKERAAIISAEIWLNAVDSGRYAESWEEAAEYFRNAVTQEQWVRSLRAVRQPLGRLISRKIRSKTYATSLPGAPDGEYVVITYDTSFEHKKAAVETVTPMRDKDGRWKVSGYYIR